MAIKVNEKNVRLNQDLLKDELIAALLIQNQLYAITNDLLSQYPYPETEELVNKIHEAFAQTIKGLLHADSREEFLAQQKRLNQLMAGIKTTFSLEGDLDKALRSFRYYTQVLRTLRNTTFSNRNEQEFAKLAFNGDFQKKLSPILTLKDEQAFADYKSELMAEILSIQAMDNLANLSSLAYMEQNSQHLAKIRLSYLKSERERMKLLFDLFWIGGGVLLLAASALFTFVAPAFIIPALLIGAATLGYGAIDFLIANVSILRSIDKVFLGKGQPTKNTIEALQALEEDIVGLGSQNFLERIKLQDEQWLTEKNVLKLVKFGLAAAGLFLAVLGLAFTLPIVGAPFTAIVVITALTVALTGATIVLWGIKVISKTMKLNAMQKEVDQQIKEDKKMLSEAKLGERKQDEFILQQSLQQETLKKTKLDKELRKQELFVSEKEMETTEENKIVQDDSEGEGEGESEGESIGHGKH